MTTGDYLATLLVALVGIQLLRWEIRDLRKTRGHVWIRPGKPPPSGREIPQPPRPDHHQEERDS